MINHQSDFEELRQAPHGRGSSLFIALCERNADGDKGEESKEVIRPHGCVVGIVDGRAQSKHGTVGMGRPYCKAKGR